MTPRDFSREVASSRHMDPRATTLPSTIPIMRRPQVRPVCVRGVASSEAKAASEIGRLRTSTPPGWFFYAGFQLSWKVSALNVAAKLLDRSSSFLLALGVVMCFGSFYTIEWSFPYCSSQEDGPAAAVFGMPFPYIRWAGASSLEYDFMPLVCALNVLALLALAWPLTRLLLRSFGERSRGMRIVLGIIGLALALVVSAGIAFAISVGAWQPTASIAPDGRDTYFDLRPVRLTMNDLHYECTPSQAWFPNRRIQQ
jgi:hypothetical protein